MNLSLTKFFPFFPTTELPNEEQLSLAEAQPADSASSAQPRRKRSSLLRRLSSALQRDSSMTRCGNFEGHRDSLEIVRRQIQADGIAYRPRIPHPILDDVDLEDGGGKCSTCSNESGTTIGAPVRTFKFLEILFRRQPESRVKRNNKKIWQKGSMS